MDFPSFCPWSFWVVLRPWNECRREAGLPQKNTVKNTVLLKSFGDDDQRALAQKSFGCQMAQHSVQDSVGKLPGTSAEKDGISWDPKLPGRNSEVDRTLQQEIHWICWTMLNPSSSG